METEFWNDVFEQLEWCYAYVDFFKLKLSKPTNDMLPQSIAIAAEKNTRKSFRKLKRNLIMISPHISQIRSALRAFEVKNERFEQHHNFDRASRDCLHIEFWTDKLHERIDEIIIERSTSIVAWTSLNIYKKAIQRADNEFNVTFLKLKDMVLATDPRLNMHRKFYSIYIMKKHARKLMCFDELKNLISNKLLSAGGRRQTNKIFREIKTLTSVEIEMLTKNRLCFVSKIKLLFKSTKNRTFPKKIVISTVKKQTDNESLKQIDINSQFLIISFILKSLLLYLAKVKLSLKFNWKYFRKKSNFARKKYKK